MASLLNRLGALFSNTACSLLATAPETIIAEFEDVSRILYNKGQKGGELYPGGPKMLQYKKELLAKIKKEPEDIRTKIREQLNYLRNRAIQSGGLNLLVVSFDSACLDVAQWLITPNCPYLDNQFLPLTIQAAQGAPPLRALYDRLAARLFDGNPVPVGSTPQKQRVTEIFCNLFRPDNVKRESWDTTAWMLDSALRKAEKIGQGVPAPACKNDALASLIALHFPDGPIVDDSRARIAALAHEYFERINPRPAQAPAPNGKPRPLKNSFVLAVLPPTPRNEVGDFKFMEDF